MNEKEKDVEQLKERMVELEGKFEELRALTRTEPADLTVRPPFKHDRALREYYSKA
jgi:hypothetical protein